MRYLLCFVFSAALAVLWLPRAEAAEPKCANPGGITYKKNPTVFAPDGTRGEGLKVKAAGNVVVVPDLRPACLPIPVRYNNFGALKTPKAGPWKGQIAKDGLGHAVFATTRDGMAAWTRWIFLRTKTPKSAFQIMSIYAPPDDCVGSIGKPPHCPYGINPTMQYAKRIADALGKGPNDKLDLDGSRCPGRAALSAVFSEVASFEIGRGFCGGVCQIDPDMFDEAADAAFGPVNPGSCADPPEAHEDN